MCVYVALCWLPLHRTPRICTGALSVGPVCRQDPLATHVYCRKWVFVPVRQDRGVQR